VVVVVAGKNILGECASRLVSFDRLCAHSLGGQLRAGVSQCMLMHVQVKPHSNPVDEQ
jgi:hypothetical protein